MKFKAAVKKRAPAVADDPQWYKDAIIYEVRVRSFYDNNGDGLGDFQGLASKLDYLQDLGVTALWLLPFYPSPLRDDGYDISDYTGVHPDCGTLDDFEFFLGEAHRRGLRVITELVLNHTSDQHPWFQRARRAPPGSVERNFYVWSETAERYGDARIIFKDFEPSNWAWDPVAKAYFWHRFYAHQPDLNFENPALQETLFSVVDFWFGLGVDGLRLDAVPYLYEQEGTNCENLPQTHEFLRALRRHVDARFKNRMLLAEANQWPEHAAAYFGRGDECHMNFHFPIMPRLFMSIHMEDRFPIMDILAQTPTVDPSCQWALFLRNHDELTLEMVTDEERDYMYRAYAHEPAMRINLGIRRRLAPLVGNDRRNMELLKGLLFSLPGTPVLYYGDEIGMGDNIYLGDRNGVRTPMQWSADRNAGFSRANPQRLILPIIIDPEYHYESLNVEAQQNNSNSLLWWMKRLIALRKRFQAFGRGSIEFLSPRNSRVFAFIRQYGDETVLVVANLSRFVQYVELDLSMFKGMVPIELFGRTVFPLIGELPYLLTLGGHAFYWFSLERPLSAADAERAAAYQPPTIELTGAWDSVLTGDEGGLLEDVLPAYLATRRWFRGRDRSIAKTNIVEAFPLRVDNAHVVLVHVEYTEGDPEMYALPLAVASESQAGELRARSPQAIVAHLRVQTSGADGIQGELYDAMEELASSRALLNAIVLEQRVRGVHGELGAARTSALPPQDVDTLPRDARLASDDHLNATVVYGNQLVLKLFRRVDDGVSPELEVGRFLTEHTDTAITPKVAGYIQYQRGYAEPMTVAVLQTYVHNEGTAWRHVRGELGRYFERVLAVHRDESPPSPPRRPLIELADMEPPPAIASVLGSYRELARLLGRRTAELHMALASSERPAFAPEPYSTLDQRSLYQSLRNHTGKAIRLLRTRLSDLSGDSAEQARAVANAWQEVLKRFDPLLARKLTSPRIRCHGDYHLGQVLYTGKDYVIIDFEGNRDHGLAQRRRKRSALDDVAGMVRSYHYAASTALLDGGIVRDGDRSLASPWARVWQTWTTAAFLGGYLDAAKGASFLPNDPDQFSLLLDAFTLDKAFYELTIELNNGAKTVSVPLHGLVYLLGLV